MAEHERPLQLLAAEIEHAMPKPQVLGRGLRLLRQRDGDRRSHGGTDDAQRGGAHLDVAGGHLGIPHLRRSLRHHAINEHHGLDADGRGGGDHVRRRPVGVEGALHHSLAVSEVQEDVPAEIPRPMDPAAEADRRADIRAAEGPGQVRTEGRGAGGGRGVTHEAGLWRRCAGWKKSEASRIPPIAPTTSASQSWTSGNRPGIHA